MSQYPGIHRAAVHEDVDPHHRCRLLVEVPAVTGGARTWAEACVTSDAMRIPARGETVWVMFEAADANHPVWLGAMAVGA